MSEQMKETLPFRDNTLLFLSSPLFIMNCVSHRGVVFFLCFTCISDPYLGLLLVELGVAEEEGRLGLGAVAQACNPSTLGGRGG